MKKIFGILTTLLFLVVFGFIAFRSYHTIKTAQESAPRHTPRPAPRILLTPSMGTGTRTIPVLATLKSRATSKVMPEVQGKIIFMSKHEGDVVTAGEVIARIESDELQTQLRVAGAQSSSVEKQTTAAAEAIRSLTSQRPALVSNEQYWQAEQDRDQQLYQQGALSKAQWEATANKWAEARGKLAALDAQINASRAQKQAVASQKDAAAQTVALWQVRNRYAEITAPVTGIISARLQEAGNYVTPNSILYHLEDTQSFRLLMQIPQQFTRELSMGQAVSLETGGLPEFRVSRLHPTVNELRQKTIEAETTTVIANPEFDRQFASSLVTAQATGLVLPPEAFFLLPAPNGSRPPRIAVYLATGGQARRRDVTPLLLTDSGAAVVNPADLTITASASDTPSAWHDSATLPAPAAWAGGAVASASSPPSALPLSSGASDSAVLPESAAASGLSSASIFPASQASVLQMSASSPSGIGLPRLLRLDFMEHARLPETLTLSEGAGK